MRFLSAQLIVLPKYILTSVRITATAVVLVACWWLSFQHHKVKPNSTALKKGRQRQCSCHVQRNADAERYFTLEVRPEFGPGSPFESGPEVVCKGVVARNPSIIS